MHTFKRPSQVVGFVVLAVLLTYGILVNKGVPYLGFAVAWSSLATFIYLQKKRKDWFVHSLYWLTIALCACMFFWTHLAFLNFLAAVGLTSVLAIVYENKKLLSVWQMLTSPLALFGKTMATDVEYSYLSSSKQATTMVEKTKFREAAVSIAVTAVALVVIIPLLAGSNPFFSHLVTETATLLNLEQLAEKLRSLSFSEWTFLQLAAFGFLLFVLPRLAAYLAEQTGEVDKPELRERSMLLPKVVVAGVLAIFLATQVQLYFASDAQLLAIGSTPAERTREVFGQLSVVCGIIIGLLHVFRSYKKIDRKITYVLLVEAAFLTLIAFSSVFQYSASFGFTFKRLWGFTAVFVMMSVLVLYARVYWKKIVSEFFVQSVLVLVGAVLVFVNIANFDYLIFHVHPPRTGEGVDWHYFQFLTVDSEAYPQIVDYALQRERLAENFTEFSLASSPRQKIGREAAEILKKYDKLDLRLLNLSEYHAYKSFRDYDWGGDAAYERERYDDFTRKQNNEVSPTAFPQSSVSPTYRPYTPTPSPTVR